MTNLKKVRPLDQHYHDLFITACEGGVNYWAQVNDYHWKLDGVDDVDGFSALLVDHEDPDEAWVLDRSVIARGWRLACGGWFSHGASGRRATPPLGKWNGYTYWDYDATHADVIVQLGLFGELVYG